MTQTTCRGEAFREITGFRKLTLTINFSGVPCRGLFLRLVSAASGIAVAMDLGGDLQFWSSKGNIHLLKALCRLSRPFRLKRPLKCQYRECCLPQ
jgi:hypothetical protein